MKNAKRLIPTPPKPPTPPAPPAPPSAPVHPAPGLASSPQKNTTGGIPGMIPGIMQKIGGSKIAGDGAPGGMPAMITEIMKKIGGGKRGGKGPSAETIKRWIKEFPLDKYRDETGKVCCPVPKEYRDKLMKRLKG